MKFSHRYFFLILILIASSFAVVAQKDDKEKGTMFSLPDTATMAETQEWLVNVLTKNSAHMSKVEQPVRQMGGKTNKESGYITSKISEVVFKGTVMSYKILQATQFSPTGGVQQQSSFPTVPQEDTTRVQFDLKDINPEEIALQPLEGDQYAQVLSIRTTDYKRAIKLKSGDTGNVTVSVASMVINTHMAEQVQNALIHLVKLAQEEKP